MIGAPNKVLIWQPQLMANDFPPVCAMTGAPAETWQKFTFTKTPPWAFWVGGAILSAVLAERVSGYLPLTKASSKQVRTLRWIFLGLILFGFALFITSFAVAAGTTGPLWWLPFLVGLGALFAGAVGMLIGRRAMGPTGKLLDQQPGQYHRLIELGNVHPAFVAAVQQHQQMRTQQAYRQ